MANLIPEVDESRLVHPAVFNELVRSHNALAQAVQATAGDDLPGPPPQRFAIKSVQPDHLVCRPVYGVGETATEGPSDVKVAKPWHHRRTPFDTLSLPQIDGQTILYTYESDTVRRADVVGNPFEAWREELWPPYLVDEQIVAEIPTGGTTNCLTDEGELIVWEDVNEAGRQWRLKPDLFQFSPCPDQPGAPVGSFITTGPFLALADGDAIKINGVCYSIAEYVPEVYDGCELCIEYSSSSGSSEGSSSGESSGESSSNPSSSAASSDASSEGDGSGQSSSPSSSATSSEASLKPRPPIAPPTCSASRSATSKPPT
jgi:hypothetical protein